MRHGVALGGIALGAVALGTVACLGVGLGSGNADGELFVEGCLGKSPDGGAAEFHLNPTFFAGEPIEDICRSPETCPGEHTNRLLIRLARTGNRVEVNDTLYIDVSNSVEVARCIRGRTEGGIPQWDFTRMIVAPDGSPTNIPFCDWTWDQADGGTSTVDGGAADDGGTSVGADGGVTGPFAMTAPHARINISTLDYVRASLAPLNSCFDQRLVGVALPGSYIEFEDFGRAAQPNLPADQRMAVEKDFKVDFGERVHAVRMHLILGDQRVTTAQKARDAVPKAKVAGVIDGVFDFDLDRSRAAQPFP